MPSLTEVPNHAAEIDHVKDIYEQEMQSLKTLQEARKTFERIYVLERLKTADTISDAELEELNKLKTERKAITSYQQEQEVALHKLKIELVNKRITYEKTMQKSVEEIKLTSEAIY